MALLMTVLMLYPQGVVDLSTHEIAYKSSMIKEVNWSHSFLENT